MNTAKYGPKLCVLTPHIRVGYECLFMTTLPFADDLRQYGFASLSKKSATQAQLDATDAFIAAMDLSTAARDADGDPLEDLKPSNVPNVHIHHIQEIIKYRALNPSLPLPPMNATLLKLLQPNESLVATAEAASSAFAAAFTLNKSAAAEKRTAIRAWQVRDTDADAAESAAKRPATDISMRALADGAVSQIGTTDPAGDFNKMISRRDQDLVSVAIEQLVRVIKSLVARSFGAQSYGRALDCIAALRAGCIVENEAAAFNAFLVDARQEFKGGARDDFWQKLKEQGVTLISADEAADSDVMPEDAARFHDDARVYEAAGEQAQPEKGSKGDDAEDLVRLSHAVCLLLTHFSSPRWTSVRALCSTVAIVKRVYILSIL